MDVDGLITAGSLGFAPGKGPGAGVTYGRATASGGSHGGLGGRGTEANYASPAYDSTLQPLMYGSGGGTIDTLSVEQQLKVRGSPPASLFLQ